jgi:hypothetical protein
MIDFIRYWILTAWAPPENFPGRGKKILSEEKKGSIFKSKMVIDF